LKAIGSFCPRLSLMSTPGRLNFGGPLIHSVYCAKKPLIDSKQTHKRFFRACFVKTRKQRCRSFGFFPAGQKIALVIAVAS